MEELQLQILNDSVEGIAGVERRVRKIQLLKGLHLLLNLKSSQLLLAYGHQ